MKNKGYANVFFGRGCGQPRPQGTFPKAREKRAGDEVESGRVGGWGGVRCIMGDVQVAYCN